MPGSALLNALVAGNKVTSGFCLKAAEEKFEAMGPVNHILKPLAQRKKYNGGFLSPRYWKEQVLKARIYFMINHLIAPYPKVSGWFAI